MPPRNEATSLAPQSCTGLHAVVRGVSLPVVGNSAPAVRKSRTSRWRAGVLIAVHLLMIAHVGQWLWAGRTLSPVEPSETMYTLNRGHLNAGFLFFAAAILATLVFGRFVCGWGCHFVAYQDLCAWLLRRMGVRPRPLRSRLLLLGPLALALYMFVWPSVYRLVAGLPSPSITNHLLTRDFWQTFPGPIIAVLTILVAGFGIVYFLGSKGFCTYACPYGGFFAPADRLAAGRILVTDACQQCGHCTAACSSNVRVHEEVARYGMVVDPGCMKCMDCVSVCPNDALYYGFARPAIAAKPKSQPRRRTFDLTMVEELVLVAVGLAALLALRGLYDLIPLLFAMGLAAMTALVALKSYRMVVEANVRWQNLSLKRGGRWTRSGAAFVGLAGLWLVFLIHSGWVQYYTWAGQRGFASLDMDDAIWRVERNWWEEATVAQRAVGDRAARDLSRADQWGLLSSVSVLQPLLWLHVARGDLSAAGEAVARLAALRPRDAEPRRAQGHLLRKAGRELEAEASFRAALLLTPNNTAARDDLIALLLATGRWDAALLESRAAVAALAERGLQVEAGAPDDPGSTDRAIRLEPARILMEASRFSEAMAELEEFVTHDADAPEAHMLLGIACMNVGRAARGLEALRRAVELAPDNAEASYNLGMALLAGGDAAAALEHLIRAVELQPDRAIYHYNLAVATFMTGRPDRALAPAQEAVRLDPDDAAARGFLDVVRRHLNPAGEDGSR